MKVVEMGRVYVEDWKEYCPIIVCPDRVWMFVSRGPSKFNDPDFYPRVNSIKNALNNHSDAAGWHWGFPDSACAEKGIYVVLLFKNRHHTPESPVELINRLTGLKVRPTDKVIEAIHD